MGYYKRAFIVVDTIFPGLAAFGVTRRVEAQRLPKQKLETDEWLAVVIWYAEETLTFDISC